MITIVNGRREQGKTTLAYFLSTHRPTRVIFDPRRMLRTSTVISEDGSGVFEMMDEEPEILVQPISDVKDAFLKTTQDVKDWTLENPDEPIVLMVDEVLFLDLPNQTYEPFEQLLRFCDTSKVDIVMTSHRPGDVSVNIRAIANYWAIFRTTQEHDLKVVRERAGDEVAEIASRLEDRQFVVWDDGKALFQAEREPAKWFVDIRKLNEVNTVHADSL